MEQKLLELREELGKGQRRMELLDRERQELRDTMLRISGAIQILEELTTRNGDQLHDQQRIPASANEPG